MAGFTFSDLLGGAFDLVRRHFPVFLRTQGVFVLLAGLLGVVVSVLVLGTMLDLVALVEGSDPEDVDPAQVARIVLAGATYPLLLALGAGLVGLVGTFFGLAAAEALLRGERPTFGSLWAAHGARFGNFFGTAVVATLVPALLILSPFLLFLSGGGLGAVALMVLVFFLLLPVVVYLVLRWWMAPAVALFEARTVGENLAESGRLMRGRYLTVLAALIVLGIANALVSSIVTMPLAAVTGSAPLTPFTPEQPPDFSLTSMAVQQLGGVLVSVLMAPLFTALLTLAYRAGRASAAPPEPGFPSAPPGFPGPFPSSGTLPPPGYVPPPGAATACSRCGAARGAGARFCAVCGTPFP